MKNKFIHLHVHTEYSLLDGLSKISDLVEQVKKLNMDSVAITDHGVMYGAVEFYKKTLKNGIKPIIGIEAYTVPDDHTIKSKRKGAKNNHLILLCKDEEGYINLMKLSSIAHLEGFYYRPRFDRKTLKKHSKGLICTSACQLGEVPQKLVEDDYEGARNLSKWFLDIFKDDYYLELQRHDFEGYAKHVEDEQVKRDLLGMSENQNKIEKGLLKLSREMGIPLVATNDVHYIKKEDARAQDALVCVATGKNVSDKKRIRFIDTPSFYLKSSEEMGELFSDYPEAIENTRKIADKCGFKITLDKWFFPEYKIESGLSPDDEMERRTWEGIEQKASKVTKEMKERIKYEMGIIEEKGYATYFLVMSDMAIWAKENGIVTNTRGSAAGSLVSYALRIIDINPLDYDLPFERFLTPWRPSPPDIDLDIADDRREEIIEWITREYGKDKVAQICTFGRMLAKASVRDIARVLGYSYSTGDRISKAIPLGSQGFPMTIDIALEQSHELKEMYDNDEEAKKIVDLAKQIEGNARHISVHAAGVVISPDDISNHTPVQLDPEGKKVITQYDMNALDPNVSPGEAVGLLKFDLLGLRNLSILGSAVLIVKAVRGVDVDLSELPLNDEKTYKMLSEGDTMGVFQLSGSGMTRYLKDLKPERIEDIMAMVALYRPGPMAQIPEYIERKRNPELIEYFDPRMKEYLGKSYGLLVYQDDVFMTAIKIAGYTWEEADKFRKAVGKKVPKEMEKQKKKFIRGAVEKGMETRKAEDLFKLIEPFSGYGFNKAHAASYGMVAYKTAYLKANFPVEFMCALLTAESNDKDKITAAVHECKRMGIKVLPPDINESLTGFTIVDFGDEQYGKAIRFGLGAIKNVGTAAIDAIVSERKKNKFRSFTYFIKRVDNRKVNKRVLESLIKVGAFDEFGNRASLLGSLDEVRSKVQRSQENKNQQALFTQKEVDEGDDSSIIEELKEFTNEELQVFERQLLGFSLSARPVDELIRPFLMSSTHKIFEISANANLDQEVILASVVTEVRIIITKRSGKEMAFVRVEDDTGSIDLVVFPSIFDKTKDYWVSNKPLLISGKVDNRDEQPSILVDSVETKDTLKESDTFHIMIPEGTSTEQLRELKRLLNENPGEKKVMLSFLGNGKDINLKQKIGWSKSLANDIAMVLNSMKN